MLCIIDTLYPKKNKLGDGDKNLLISIQSPTRHIKAICPYICLYNTENFIIAKQINTKRSDINIVHMSITSGIYHLFIKNRQLEFL